MSRVRASCWRSPGPRTTPIATPHRSCGLLVGPVVPLRVEPVCQLRPRPADGVGEESVDQRAYGAG